MQMVLRPIAPFVLVVLASAVPFAGGGGCGRTACFQVTAEAYAKNGNACPPQSDALQDFSSPACPGPVTAVDGPGTFDAESQICCYPVTYDDITPNCGQGGSGLGGAGSSFDGESTCEAFVSAATGFGGTGGSNGTGPACVSSCAEAITKGGVPCGSAGGGDYKALVQCAGCAGPSLPCTAQCAAFCGQGPIEGDCGSCLQTSCPMQLTSCVND